MWLVLFYGTLAATSRDWWGRCMNHANIGKLISVYTLIRAMDRSSLTSLFNGIVQWYLAGVKTVLKWEILIYHWTAEIFFMWSKQIKLNIYLSEKLSSKNLGKPNWKQPSQATGKGSSSSVPKVMWWIGRLSLLWERCKDDSFAQCWQCLVAQVCMRKCKRKELLARKWSLCATIVVIMWMTDLFFLYLQVKNKL